MLIKGMGVWMKARDVDLKEEMVN